MSRTVDIVQVRDRRRRGQTIGLIAIEMGVTPDEARACLYPLPPNHASIVRAPRPRRRRGPYRPRLVRLLHVQRVKPDHSLRIAVWWAQGLRAREIAERLPGWTTYMVNHQVAWMRRNGWDLPRRNPGRPPKVAA